jgi:hypothetical protein
MAAVLNKKGATKINVGIAKAAVKTAARQPMTPVSRGSYVCRIEVSKQGRAGKSLRI